MCKWYGVDEDGRDDFWTSGSDDVYDGISGMGGFGPYGREACNGLTYGNGREKSDAALRRQEEAEAKFKALAQGTPANLSGTAQTFELLSPDPKLHLTDPCWRDFKKYVGGWKGWKAKRHLQKPGNETESNGSSAAATNAVAKKAKGKKLYVIEVCLAAAAAAPAAKPSAGGATKVQKPKAAKPLAGAVAKEKKPKGPKAPKATAPKVPDPREEEELRRESLAETPEKGAGGGAGKKRKREEGHLETVKRKNGRRLLWTLHYSATRLQWYNHNVTTKATSWSAPDSPEGWVKKKGSGTHRPYVGLKLYYFNATTRESSYEVPTYID